MLKYENAEKLKWERVGIRILQCGWADQDGMGWGFFVGWKNRSRRHLPRGGSLRLPSRS
jgi:hypothetical protein